MAVFPTGVPTNSDLYVALDNFGATLTSAIDDTVTTIPLSTVAGLPTVGILTIETEKVKYTGISGSSVTGATRGFSSTTPAAHASGVGVWFNVVEEHHNVLKDETIAIAQNLSNRIGLSTTQILAPSGSDAAPSITFTGDTDTGIYRGGSDILQFSSGGVSRLVISTSDIVSGIPLRVQAGSAATPSYSFQVDINTGIYSSAADRIAFSCNGQLAAQITETGLWLSDGTASAPTYTFAADPDTGIYRAAANDIRFTAGGVRALQVTPGAVTIGRHETPTTSMVVYGNQSARRYSDDTSFDRIQIQKYRGTVASPTAAQSGDVLAMFEAQAYDGFTIRSGSQITTTLSGTIGSNQVPSYMSFLVASASGVPGERLRITGPGSQLQIVDGSAAAPTLSFLSDTDTGIYRSGINELGFATAGLPHMNINSDGHVRLDGRWLGEDGENFQVNVRAGAFDGGGQRTIGGIRWQNVGGVSTTAKNILSLTGVPGMVVVTGSDGSSQFQDILNCSTVNLALVSELIVGGAPAARTYSLSSGILRVAMASGTYRVSACSIGARIGSI